MVLRETAQHPLTRGLAHLHGKRGIGCQLFYRFCQSGCVIGWNNKAFYTITNEMAASRHIGNDKRAPAARRFQHGARQALARSCRHDTYSAVLADAIEKLATDPALAAQMGKAARKRVLGGFTQDHVRRAALEIYETLLDDGKSARR